MTYEIYRYIFIIAAIVAAVLLVISVILFFFLKIPKVISNLSGIAAKKAIKDIREQNERTGDKSYKASAYNQSRGKITDKIGKSGSVNPVSESSNFGYNSEILHTKNLPDDQVPQDTTVLYSQDDTTVLEQEEYGTTVLNSNIYDNDFSTFSFLCTICFSC